MPESSSSAPLFSIVIPCYGAEKFIQTTLDSIYAQSEGDYEIVVVHDESPDGTLAILQAQTDTRLRIIDQKNAGECGARNRGVREARGQFIAFLDSDDVWRSDHLELARDFFAAHPDIHWYTSRHERCSDIESQSLNAPSPRLSGGREGYYLIRWFLEGDKRTTCSNVVARRSILEGRDYFPLGVKMHGDSVGWCRLATEQPILGCSDRVTMLYRIWGGSASDNYLRAFESPENNALSYMQEMAAAADCSEEAALFYKHFGLVNWWQRISGASLSKWLPEIERRRAVTGSWLSCGLKLGVLCQHLICRLMRFSVRRKMLRLEKEQQRLIREWEKSLK